MSPLPGKVAEAGLAVRGKRSLAALLLTFTALLAGVQVEAAPPVGAALRGGRSWVSGELLVGFRAGVGAPGRHALYQKHGAQFLQDVGQRTRIVRLRVPAGSEDSILRRLARLPEVKFVEKNFEFTPALVPDDPEYLGQWHLPQIQAEQAWDLGQGSASAIIAILDSGIDAAQPDFAGKLVAGYNTYANSSDTSDAFGHGTEVAGVAGALTNNGLGVAGVAGNAPLMPVRVTDANGAANAASIANGIIWATDHGARVINLSFDGIVGNATIGAAAEYALNHGTLVVAAAGNCGCANAQVETPFVLSVSATDRNDALAWFSSTGPYVDVAAPGTDILTTAKYGLYLPDSGTSLASPVVAGVAGLMFGANPALTPTAATELLESTAVDLGNAGYDPSFGYGRINALAALTAAINYAPPVDGQPPSVAMTSPSAGATVSGIVVIDVVADDNVGVVNVDLLVDGVYYASDGTSPYSFAWDASALSDGPHVLEAVASDSAGNSAHSTSLTVTVANAPGDKTPPKVAITAPASGSSVTGTIKVTADASDDTGVVNTELYVDGALIAADTAAPYEFSWNSALSSDGVHTLDVLAADAAGNVAHATVTVTVANRVRHAPVANDDAFTAPLRTRPAYAVQMLAVLANDTDADGDLKPSTVRIVREPNHGGTARALANGIVAYAPRRGFSGVETFVYTVRDKRGALSNRATVSVTIK
jgi:thermitase